MRLSSFLLLSFLTLAGVISASFVSAANSGDVVINEIAWMGTTASYNDEWIELKNNTDQEVNLDGWVLKAADGTPEIKLTRTVLVSEFYLLERTNDSTVLGITADQTYAGALNNGGEKLELYDSLGNLIDSIDAASGWPAGDNTTKQTMERSLSAPGADNWQTSQNPGGTPMAENSSLPTTETAETGSPLTQEISEENFPTTTPPVIVRESYEVEPRKIEYPSGVVINEILPSPIGTDKEEEWVEIFNQNNFEINLAGWQIADTVGSIKTYTIPEETTLGARGFLVFPRPDTEITLNNSGDGLNLIRPDGEVADSVTHEKAPRGQSYNRTDPGWFWGSVLTPGSANVLPTAQTPKPTIEEPSPVKELAAVSESLDLARDKRSPGNSDSLPIYLYLAAVFTSLSSGVIILVLKRKSHVRT